MYHFETNPRSQFFILLLQLEDGQCEEAVRPRPSCGVVALPQRGVQPRHQDSPAHSGDLYPFNIIRNELFDNQVAIPSHDVIRKMGTLVKEMEVSRKHKDHARQN